METERKLLKIPLGFRSKIPRRGIYEYQRPENFAKHNALCKRDENYGILMGKPNNAICLDYDIYDPNCKDKQKYTLEYFKKCVVMMFTFPGRRVVGTTRSFSTNLGSIRGRTRQNQRVHRHTNYRRLNLWERECHRKWFLMSSKWEHYEIDKNARQYIRTG